jgi:hypothetical protein
MGCESEVCAKSAIADREAKRRDGRLAAEIQSLRRKCDAENVLICSGRIIPEHFFTAS